MQALFGELRSLLSSRPYTTTQFRAILDLLDDTSLDSSQETAIRQYLEGCLSEWHTDIRTYAFVEHLPRFLSLVHNLTVLSPSGFDHLLERTDVEALKLLKVYADITLEDIDRLVGSPQFKSLLVLEVETMPWAPSKIYECVRKSVLPKFNAIRFVPPYMTRERRDIYISVIQRLSTPPLSLAAQYDPRHRSVTVLFWKN